MSKRKRLPVIIDDMNVLLREEPPTLEWIQEYIGGYMEIVSLKDGGQMIVNEEGKILGLPLNRHATLVLGQMPNDWVVGPAIFLYEDAKLS